MGTEIVRLKLEDGEYVNLYVKDIAYTRNIYKIYNMDGRPVKMVPSSNKELEIVANLTDTTKMLKAKMSSTDEVGKIILFFQGRLFHAYMSEPQYCEDNNYCMFSLFVIEDIPLFGG